MVEKQIYYFFSENCSYKNESFFRETNFLIVGYIKVNLPNKQGTGVAELQPCKGLANGGEAHTGGMSGLGTSV